MNSRKLNETKIFDINHELLHHDWSYLDNLNVNGSYEYFSKILSETIDKYAPMKTYKIPPKKILRGKWMSKSLLKCTSKSYKLYKRQIGKPRDSVERQQYVNYRNALNRVKTYARSSYYKNLIETHKNDSRKLWGIVNELTGKIYGKSSIVQLMTQNGSVTEDTVEISEMFNEHFATAGSNVANSLPLGNRDPTKFIKKSLSQVSLVLSKWLVRLK